MTRATAALLGLSLLLPHLARAADASPVAAPPENRSPYEVNWALDIGLAVGGLVVFGLPRMLADETVSAPCGLECEPDDVNLLDRTVIGKRNHAADRVSDVSAGLGYSLPYLYGLLDLWLSESHDGWEGYARDVVVLFETFSLTLAVNNLLNLVVRRPRPLVYDEDESDAKRLAADSSLSFPSGHTSGAFAMATAYGRLFMRRHPDSPLVVPVWLSGYALAATAGALRTEAGEHFWTDVLAGAVLGIGMGLLVPWLHERSPATAEGRTAGAPPVRWLVTPTATPGGGVGAALIIR